MARTRLYFVSDLHGSSKCFRKFINAGPIYKADVLILGGDVAGKALQAIESQGGGRWRTRFVGTDHLVEEGPELEALEKLIDDHGYYPYRAEPGELEAMQGTPAFDALFLRLMQERLTGWLTLADERLRPLGLPLYFMLGNDDPVELAELLDRAPWGTHDEGKVVWLDDEHEMISWGYSNITPWHSHREQTEEQLTAEYEVLAGQLQRPERAVFNVHVPPFGTQLDDAPQARRRPPGPGRPRPGPDRRRREHRGPRVRAGPPAAARAARPHPRVVRHPQAWAGPWSSTRAATTRRAP